MLELASRSGPSPSGLFIAGKSLALVAAVRFVPLRVQCDSESGRIKRSNRQIKPSLLDIMNPITIMTLFSRRRSMTLACFPRIPFLSENTSHHRHLGAKGTVNTPKISQEIT